MLERLRDTSGPVTIVTGPWGWGLVGSDRWNSAPLDGIATQMGMIMNVFKMFGDQIRSKIHNYSTET